MALRSATFRRTTLVDSLPRPAPARWWLLVTGVPAVLVVVLLYLAVFGQSGLVRRHRLMVDLENVERRLKENESENARLLREIRQLKEDAPTMERAAAEELLLVPPGSTIYRFE